MYKIETKDYGIKLTFADFIIRKEIEEWSEKIILFLDQLPDRFGMLIDMRELKPLPVECQEIMEKTQLKFKTRVVRSATIVNNIITDMQFKRIGKKTGVNSHKIFIDASKVDNWEEIGVNWIVNGVKP